MTVGRMAVTQIWVPEIAVERAKELMLEAEIEHALGAEVRGGAIADREALPMKLIALIVAVLLGAAVVQAALRVF